MNKNAELVFFSKWLRSPMRVASVMPSSSQLARAMASALPDREGLVVELGGGTGPVTHALLDAGVRAEQLVVIERDPHFHRHLMRRFPGVAVLLGDAFEMHALVSRLAHDMPIRAVVSGLPLVPMSAAEQRRIISQTLQLTGGAGPLIQFSYSLTSPLQKSVKHELGLSSHCVTHVWRNIPPAKVWRYERQELPQVLLG
jgi:phospholipid N-methyltransferase